MPPVPVVPVVPDIVMPVATPLITRVPSLRMLTCTVMARLVLEPLGPLRVSMSVPLTAPLPTVTLLAVIWILQVVKGMTFPTCGPWLGGKPLSVTVKVQDPKATSPLAVELPPKLNVVELGKVNVTGLFPIPGSKIEPFGMVNCCPNMAWTVVAFTGTD